jgi:hypothetical protein
MRPSFSLALLGIFFGFFSLTACQQEEAPASAPKKSGIVEASRAYLDNFGTPPQGKAGEAFARVGYLPLQDFPGKLRALPLFLFSDKGELQHILNRLIGGELKLPADFGLYNPFPDDLEVKTTPLGNPTVTLSLATQQSWSDSDMAAAGRALAETVFQFDAVKRVIITLGNQPLPQMPADGYLHEPLKLVEVKPPTLVLIAGMWEQGADEPDELLVEFDRPITVNNFKLYDNSGKAVDGEYFTSIFQMAVVILPKDPSRYQEATLLRAEWDVVDGLGRSNNGTTTLPLQRFEH